MEFLLAAISLGFLGSFHCLGMCGPIALALPIGKQKGIARLVSILVYNLGRAFTYSVFGALFGLIGFGFALGGLQQALSITVGTLLLLSVTLPSSFHRKFKATAWITEFLESVKRSLSSLFATTGARSLFTIGLLNGLLPCGLVYVAVAGAIATGSVFNGSLFMAVFALGTFPMMMAVPYFSAALNAGIRSKIRKAVPVMVGAMAVLLILRGLNLGIPYLSPDLRTASSACHSSDHNQAHVLVCPAPEHP